MDLVRPLGLAGIPCAVVSRPGDPHLYSRFTRAALYWEESWEDAEGLVELLLRFAGRQSEPPVLFYADYPQLLLLSRYRERLAPSLRFVIADAGLVEDLVDKARFQTLAERLQLPVPATRRLHPAIGSTPARVDLRFPVIIKPLTRRKPWDAIAGTGKAVHIESQDALRKLWPRLVEMGMDLVVQELIPGPESCIESYHVYVDQQGAIVGEFTGRKIRTYPTSYGQSTALVITSSDDVTALGRELVQKLSLRGVAKFDFKRAPDGRLQLLEINPRFNLWHHLGAVAGVNLPALVYADLVGLPRPAVSRPRAGVRWCRLRDDVHAARACGMPFTAWLLWALRCEAKSTVAWDDPMPLLRGALSHLASFRRALPNVDPRREQSLRVGQ
jgi:predicted ATP-grasp superfamily ATP-dependent carboligase